MSKIEDKAVDLLDKLDNLAMQYTPEVMDAALGAVSMSAISELMTTVAMLLVAGIIAAASRWFWKFAIRKEEECERCNDWDGARAVGTTCSIFVISILSVVSIFRLVDVWVWTAIFNPKLALAHQILGL